MATIPIYDSEAGTSYTVTATVESSIIAGSGSGRESYYIKLTTQEKDPEGGSIPDQVVEDIAGSTVTAETTDALAVIVEHAEGVYVSTESSLSTKSSSSESTQSESSSTGSSRSTSSATSANSASSGSSDSSGSSPST